jgi:isopentenyl-diphosphate delta-isomerase
MHLIKADALAIHLNPLQELIQLEGNPNFRGVLRGIERLVKALDIPIIIKEVGAGISAEVARRLIRVGIRIIDVAGAGGTSWAGVEILRRKDERIKLGQFWDWGIPTVDALRSVSKLKGELHKELGQRKSGSAFDKRKALKHLILVASGGIEDGVDMAKSIALGADLVSSARPLLQALLNRGKRNLADILDQWEMELRGVMFLVGASNVEALSKVKLIESK